MWLSGYLEGKEVLKTGEIETIKNKMEETKKPLTRSSNKINGYHTPITGGYI